MGKDKTKQEKTPPEGTDTASMSKKEIKKEKKKEKKEKRKAKRKKIPVIVRILRVILIILLIFVIIYGVIAGLTKQNEINYFYSSVANAVKAINDGTYMDDINGGGEDAAPAETNIDFTPGTYGGIEFKTIDDVVNYYAECYNKTKGETSNYIDADGNNATFYTMLGDESLEIEGSILIDGKDNSMIDSLVPGIVGGLFTPGILGLPPCASRDMLNDVDENGDSLSECRLVPEDVAGASVAENDDGSITLTIQPVKYEMSHKGLDSQGHLFNALGAIDSTVEQISVLSWSEGTTAENCKVTYEGGNVAATIDPSTGKITEADYKMVCNVNVTHANVAVIKDKSASLTLVYAQHFPASDEYLMDTKGLKRA